MSEFMISRLEGGSGLKVVGELDLATVPQLTEALDGASRRQVILDFSELTFLDSCGVRAILEFARAQNGNGPVVILDASDAVRRVLEIVGVDTYSGVELRRTEGQAP